jgi:hypothetical protein
MLAIDEEKNNTKKGTKKLVTRDTVIRELLKRCPTAKNPGVD